jgi:hypothetical protein
VGNPVVGHTSGADALDNGNPLSIARLNKLRLSTSLRTSDNFYRPNHAHLEAYLVKVVHIIIINAVLSFSLLHKLKPRANHLRILLLYPLPILCSIERHFELVCTRHEPLRLILTY